MARAEDVRRLPPFPPVDAPLLRWEKWGLGLLIGAGTLVAVGLCVFRKFSADEYEHMHAAWALAQGQIPYVDFFEHHHPLMYVLLTPVLKTFGEGFATLVAARLFLLVPTALGFFALWSGARRVFGRRAALFCLPLWFSAQFFYDKGIEIRPDNPMVAMQLLALERFLAHRESGRGRDLFWAGLCLFVAFAFLQKAVFFAIPLGLVVGFLVYRGQISRRHGMLFAAGFAGPLALFTLALLGTGHFEAYWLTNWTYNLHRAGNLPRIFKVHPELGKSLFVDFFFWAAAVHGLVATAFNNKGSPSARALAFIAVVLFAFPLFRSLGTPQYFLPAIPLFALFAAATLASFPRANMAWLGICLAIPALHFSFNPPAKNTDQRLVQQYVLANASPEGCVMDGDKAFNVFRPHCDYLWFLTDHPEMLALYPQLRGRSFDGKALVKEKMPQLLHGMWVEETDPFFSTHYEKTPHIVVNGPVRHPIYRRREQPSP
jgi:hypothetical protein